MKVVRFMAGDIIGSGVLTDGGIRETSGDFFTTWDYTGRSFAEEDIKLLAPINPRTIIGMGKNFVAPEQVFPEAPKLPILFFKPASSVIGPEETIVIPEAIDEIVFESELAVVMGRRARHLSSSRALDYVFGYTVANDVAALQYFHPEGHWTVGKSFDTFCPLGPVIETELELESVRIEAYLNGKKKQDSHISLMIMLIAQQIAYISSFMTLMPGDIILTGTPVGKESLRVGDRIDCRIEGIGMLSNPVAKFSSETYRNENEHAHSSALAVPRPN